MLHALCKAKGSSAYQALDIDNRVCCCGKLWHQEVMDQAWSEKLPLSCMLRPFCLKAATVSPRNSTVPGEKVNSLPATCTFTIGRCWVPEHAAF